MSAIQLAIEDHFGPFFFVCISNGKLTDKGEEGVWRGSRSRGLETPLFGIVHQS